MSPPILWVMKEVQKEKLDGVDVGTGMVGRGVSVGGRQGVSVGGRQGVSVGGKASLDKVSTQGDRAYRTIRSPSVIDRSFPGH